MKRFLLFLIVAAVVVAGAYFFIIDEATKLGDATEITNVAVYLTTEDGGRIEQNTFNLGDPIEVGFEYEGVAEDSLVSFVVLENSEDEVFSTNTFTLSETNSEIFVSINNVNLPVGEYTVEVRDVDGEVVEKVDYEITEDI